MTKCNKCRWDHGSYHCMDCKNYDGKLRNYNRFVVIATTQKEAITVITVYGNNFLSFFLNHNITIVIKNNYS